MTHHLGEAGAWRSVHGDVGSPAFGHDLQKQSINLILKLIKRRRFYTNGQSPNISWQSRYCETRFLNVIIMAHQNSNHIRPYVKCICKIVCSLVSMHAMAVNRITYVCRRSPATDTLLLLCFRRSLKRRSTKWLGWSAREGLAKIELSCTCYK